MMEFDLAGEEGRALVEAGARADHAHLGTFGTPGAKRKAAHVGSHGHGWGCGRDVGGPVIFVQQGTQT